MKHTRRWASLLVVAMLLLSGAVIPQLRKPADAAHLNNRIVKMASAEVSAHTTYVVSFDFSSSTSFGSVLVQFCSNDPFIGTSCVAPGGFSASSATLASQTGPGGFSIGGGSTANQLILERTTATPTVGTVSFTFNNIINPSSPGSYYVRLQTFSSGNATGTATYDGGLAFSINNTISVSAEVPPYLIFCTGITITGLNCVNANGSYIDFGILTTNAARHATSQMLVATNAQSGYGITVDGTTLTSGNNEIEGLFNGDVSRPGVAQFGFNLRANSAPIDGADPIGPGSAVPTANYNAPNTYRFRGGELIVSNPGPDDVREYTASYIANVPTKQASGIYVSTITYLCLASF